MVMVTEISWIESLLLNKKRLKVFSWKMQKRIVILSWSSYIFNLKIKHLFSKNLFEACSEVQFILKWYPTELTVVSRPVHRRVFSSQSAFVLIFIKKSHVFHSKNFKLGGTLKPVVIGSAHFLRFWHESTNKSDHSNPLWMYIRGHLYPSSRLNQGFQNCSRLFKIIQKFSRIWSAFL